MTYKSNNFKFGKNPYASHDEWEAAQSARIAEQEEDAPDLEWTASNGQCVQVYRDSSGFMVKLDGKEHFGHVIGEVPARLADAAAKHGVVAMLGPVGLNAERKSALEGLRKWGK